MMKLTKTSLYLLVILGISLILRIIAAHHSPVSTDEMIYSLLPLDIISAGRLGTIEQSPLFFYLTDLGYKIFGGMTGISARLAVIIYGALASLVVFMVSQELFKNKKASLISAFMFAVSGFSLTLNYEMDMAAFFFALTSMLFFIKALKGKQNLLYLAVVFLALGALIKNIVLLFVPVYILIWAIYAWREKIFFKSNQGKISFKKKPLKIIVFSLLIAVIIVSPVLIYNYETYQEKGITDYYFSTMLGIGETVHKGLEGQKWAFSTLQKQFYNFLSKMLKLDIALFISGMMGFFLSFRKRKYLVSTLILSMLILFLYLAGQSGVSSHYLWLPLVLSVFSGYTFVWLKQKFKFQYLIPVLLILVVILNIGVMKEIINSRDESITLELRDYVHDNIPEDALVVIDPRIYRGIHAWVFNDRHYIDGIKFFQITQDGFSGKARNVPLYYVECGQGTNCGWKPEDFERVYDTGKEISDVFKKNTEHVATVSATHTFLIHQGNLEIPANLFNVIDQTHVFWFYPVGWKYPELAVDAYPADGLHYFGLVVLYLDLILALLTIPFILYLVFSREVHNFFKPSVEVKEDGI